MRDNINVDGLKFLPREIEDVLLEHPAVDDCAVVGLPDPIRYQRPAAMVVLAAQTDLPAMVAELHAFCRWRLDFHKVPTCFYFTEAIPRTELGKINRDALIELMTQSEQLHTVSDETRGGLIPRWSQSLRPNIPTSRSSSV